MKTALKSVKTKRVRKAYDKQAGTETCAMCGLPQRFLNQPFSPAELIMYHPLAYCICNQLSED
jgi:hypothetical protein